MQILNPATQQPHGNLEVRLFAHESLYWVTMNTDIGDTVKHCWTCLEYKNTWLLETIIPHKVLAKPRGVVGTDIFMINSEILLCTVNSSKYLEVNKVESMSAEDLA